MPREDKDASEILSRATGRMEVSGHEMETMVQFFGEKIGSSIWGMLSLRCLLDTQVEMLIDSWINASGIQGKGLG